MFCKYCGAPVPDGTKFCPQCGGALTPVSEASKAETPKPQPAPKPQHQPQPQQQAYTPEPEVDEEPKKPYMSLKELFAGTKLTMGGAPIVNKRNLILFAVGLVVLVILGLCSH